jgi:hypothetical protein
VNPPGGRVAVIGDVGGHLTELRRELRRLGAEEATAALGRYADAHPRAWSALRPVLEETLGARIDESGTDLPMIALELDAARSRSRST